MLRAEVWIATTLISVGVIGGLLYNWPAAQTPNTRDNPPSIESPLEQSFAADSLSTEEDTDGETSQGPVVSSVADEIEKGDDFLLGGNYDGAYRAYVKSTNQKKGVASSSLLIRMALASEQFGNLDQAALLYQNTIKHSRGRDDLRLLALSGLSRVWIDQGRHDQSLELLAELDLLYGSLEQAPAEIRYQILYQLSEAAQRQYLKLTEPNNELVADIEFQWCEPELETILDIANQKTSSAPPELANPTFTLKILQRPSDDVNQIAISSQTPIIPIRELLQVISDKTSESAAGLVFDISSSAHAAIMSRTAKLNLQGQLLSNVLDSIANPSGLVWQQDGTTIMLRHHSESPQLTTVFRKQRAIRSLRRLGLTLPPSARRRSSNLHQGNIAMIAGDLETASTRYLELKTAGATGELAAKLNYNMAILDRLNNQPDASVQRLYFAVDQSLDHEIQAKSYSRIAKMHLENGDTEGAIYAASRGLTLATTPRMRETTALIMSRAYLLRNEPFAANKVLFDNEAQIETPTSRHLAAAYGAYARYLGLPISDGIRNERTRLIIALSAVDSNDTENFLDALLIARAHFAAGFSSRAMQLAEQAMNGATSAYWKRQAAYDLATLRYNAGDLEEALTAFAVIFEQNPIEASDVVDTLGIKAQLKCAAISLTLKRPEDCLDHCQQIWAKSKGLTEAQKAETLTLMGTAYQRLGRHRTAAVCFSGMVPQFDASNEEPNQ